MEITKKLKSLVSIKQASRSSLDLPDTETPEIEEKPIFREKEPVKKGLNDPEVEKEILNSIEDIFYSNESFDASEYKLKEVSDDPDKDEIFNEKVKLVTQLHVVSKKLSDLILQNQSALAEELQHVTEMQRTLEEACTTCAQSRNLLARTKTDFTSASLGILASYRKREQLRCLLRSLHMVKTLQETDVRLRELLEEEDYPGAIQLCLECQRAAGTFKHFSCISELSSKLQDTLVMTEEQLDVALSRSCSRFDKTHYQRLQAAYALLGKTQTAVDQLLMHFAGAVHNTAFAVVLQSAGAEGQKKQYPDLCRLIQPENFSSCLQELCSALWRIMRSYWCILEWHGVLAADGRTVAEGGDYVQQKLGHGLLRVWQDVQQKVRHFLLAVDVTPFKFDEFIRILATLRRLVEAGEDFCGSRSEELREAVRKQSVNYFRNYHRGFMEELRTFLENESWEACPVHPSFSAVHLQEFRFLSRGASRSFSSTSPEKEKGRRENNLVRNGTDPFREENGSPEDDETEDFLQEDEERRNCESDSDDADVPDELKRDFIEENAGEEGPRHSDAQKKRTRGVRKRPAPVLTNTALSVLRSFGKYMQMMSALKPIAFDVLICMTQLFDYCMYSVYIFFAKEMSDLNENVLSNKLKTTLKRIRENLILEEGTEEFDNRNKDRVPAPSPSPAVDLKRSEHLHGLAERVAAAESLVFLAEQFELLHPHLESLIPPAKRAFLQQFCSQTVSQASELRRPAYMAVSARALDYEQAVTLMASVRWDGQEIASQHSAYVDILLRELQVFSMRLQAVSRRIPIPRETHDLLWEHCVRFANHAFVEGFSQARRCTNGGRALMQLDYQQFVSKAELLTGLQPLPGKELVEGYVKAYYMLEQNLEQWIRSHREYTNKQLVGLISCISQLNKKGRQRLLALVEEGGDRPRR